MTGEARPAVLVTGAAGFIGAALVAALKADPRFPTVAKVVRSDVDLSDRRGVEACLAQLRPRQIVHLAASLDRGDDAAARTRLWRDTFVAGKNILEAAAAADVEQVLVAGSIEELGKREGVITADLVPQPVSPYGFCKAALCALAEAVARSNRMRVDWFRPFTVYGPGQLGPMFLPYAIDCAIHGRAGEFSDGRQRRDFLYVADLVSWIQEALAYELVKAPGRLVIHHVGSGVATSLDAVIALVARHFPGAEFRFGVRPRRAGEPDIQVAPAWTPTAEGPWEWRPEVPVEDGVRRTVLARTASQG